MFHRCQQSKRDAVGFGGFGRYKRTTTDSSALGTGNREVEIDTLTLKNSTTSQLTPRNQHVESRKSVYAAHITRRHPGLVPSSGMT